MTETIIRMSETYPAEVPLDRDALSDCIAVCLECAQSCTACADACLGEESVADLRRCIRLNLDCADMCETTAKVLSRHTAFEANDVRAVLEACLRLCKSCGDECAHHSMHEHCSVCAEVCRRCADACQRLAATIADG